MKAVTLDPAFTFHYVSINTSGDFSGAWEAINFTFHYVSINTGAMDASFGSGLPLHSTMFLLIP